MEGMGNEKERFCLLQGSGDNKAIRLNDNFPFTFGRDRCNSLQIRDRSISKQHLTVSWASYFDMNEKSGFVLQENDIFSTANIFATPNIDEKENNSNMKYQSHEIFTFKAVDSYSVSSSGPAGIKTGVDNKARETRTSDREIVFKRRIPLSSLRDRNDSVFSDIPPPPPRPDTPLG
ncbi:hypothetical protein GUITHDRAFT_101181 [Guillardia theta CCMP2712]|uniref:FHA domain-containing protein n=1 Tax=Guillardia theta (strain CCMP2712) TaxID=905079 RepID=L1JZ38_GUITC|nr:hypothetical protein GUITHDRAFT_101181 [Guillardia theta CCMP2712]EKX53480.1 hypothetical protein GUITHDRAFT_101181 [Guillardia theta CCMP2712]|eukprot:XP_005840460.1 hypothetical protein GUITHDRAFT_101181 [Guillardia theta CCMP2712]